MKFRSLFCFCLMIVLSFTSLDAGYRQKQNSSPPRCERYNRALCAPHIGNELIYLKGGDTVRERENRVPAILSMISGYLSKNCLKYALPVLCHWYLPTCSQNTTTKQTIAKPKQFCRDECEIFQNLICATEFRRGRGYPIIENANCSMLPAVGSEEHAQCMRIGITDFKPKVMSKMRNVTVNEGEQAHFKCHINKAESFNWYKDGQPLEENSRIRIQDRYRRSSRLKIKNTKTRDRGYYSCSGANYGGEASAGAWLFVRKSTLPQTTRSPGHTRKPKTSARPTGPTTELLSSPDPDGGRCERYTGTLCAQYLENGTIFVTRDQSLMEQELQSILQLIENRYPLTSRCKEYSLPAMCLHMHQACEEDTVEPIPRLCREDCHVLEDDICRTELQLVDQLTLYAKAYIPSCAELPQTDNSLSSYCVPLNIKGRATPESKNTLKRSDCYEDKGEHYSGTVNITESGHTCRDWDLDKPELGWSHNHCRNPGGVWRRPWCFIAKGDWEYCKLKSCPLERYPNAAKQSSRSHTLYVICSIVAVLVFVCVVVIAYVKIQSKRVQSKRSTSSSVAITKGNSLESSESGKQSVSDVKSFILREIQEVTHGKVKFLELMGEGTFGRVFKGAMMNGDEISPDFITIKKIKDTASPNALENFRTEINVVAALQHPNLVCLLGVSAKEGPLFSVFEYAGEMNLRQYLQLGSPGYCRDSSRMEYYDESVLLEIALQIADGMYYLSENKFTHRDLATRNCYITDPFTVKISNLGLGNYKYPTDYCLMHGNMLLPVRWAPPEVVTCLKFSMQSDVWAFGITLWEIFSHGQQPYGGLSNQEVIQKIKSLTLLACPDNCPARMYSIMRECWEESPADRPHFKDIFMRLRELSGDRESDCYKPFIT